MCVFKFVTQILIKQVPSSFVKDLNDVEMQMRVSIQSSQAKDDRKKKENNSLNNLVTFVRQRIKEMANYTQEQTRSRPFPCAHGIIFGIRDMVLKMGDKISCAQVDCVLALCFECVTFGLIGIAMCSAHIRNEKEYREPKFSFLDSSSSSSSNNVAKHAIRAMSDIPLKSGNVNASDNELSQDLQDKEEKETADDEDKELGFADSLLAQGASIKRARESKSLCRSTKHVHPTTCCVERLFSRCKLNMAALRNKMDLDSLDMSMFHMVIKKR